MIAANLDHVAEVKEDPPPDGRLQPMVWDDKGMGMLLRNLIDVTGCFACPMLCAMLLYSLGAL